MYVGIYIAHIKAFLLSLKKSSLPAEYLARGLASSAQCIKPFLENILFNISATRLLPLLIIPLTPYPRGSVYAIPSRQATGNSVD